MISDKLCSWHGVIEKLQIWCFLITLVLLLWLSSMVSREQAFSDHGV